jgi:hypothetical protein
MTKKATLLIMGFGISVNVHSSPDSPVMWPKVCCCMTAGTTIRQDE